MGTKVKDAAGAAASAVELFPPVVLLSALALYFYVAACIGQGGEGAP